MAKKKKTNNVSVRTQLAVATAAVCLLALFGVFVAWLDQSVVMNKTARSYADVTIKGTVVCLPLVDDKSHAKDKAEGTCVQGIKTKSGVYYELKGTVDRKDDAATEVTGTLTPPTKGSGVVTNGRLTIE